jgi:hypothetical protein
MRAAQFLGALLATWLLGACGGRVNLGEKAEPGPSPGVAEPMGPDAPVGKLVAQLSAEIRVDLMVATSDFLYVGNFEGLSRCRKSNCISTLELLRGVGSNLDHVQVHGESLGVGHNETNRTWLAAYSLPEGGNERVVFDNLPNGGARSTYWHGDFVYWGVDIDHSVYRCRLPRCEPSPERLGSFVNLRTIRADGELVFWNDDFFIYRSSNFGADPVATLIPDELLSEAQSDAGTGQPLPDAFFEVQSLAVRAGMVYASIGPISCAGDCQYQVVRWPVAGGAREPMLSSPAPIEALFIFGNELSWAASASSFDAGEPATLWSCLLDSCEATHRKLGYVVAPLGQVVMTADDTDLYWLEAGPNPTYTPGTARLTNGQIRRAPRLSPGKP